MRAIALSALLVACGSSAKTYTAGTQAGAPWPVIGHDEGFSARAGVSGARSGVVKWRLDTGAFVGTASPVVAADGTIYVGNSAGTLFAVRADGSLAWQRAVGGAIEGAPAIAADGAIWVAADDARLHVLSPDGTESASSSATGSLSSSVVLDGDGRAYFTSERLGCDATRGGDIACYDLGDGAPIAAAREPVAIAAGRLYETNPGGVTAYDTSPIDLTAGVLVAPGVLGAVADDGTTFVVSDGRVEAHDRDGGYSWSCDIPSFVPHSYAQSVVLGVARSDLVYLVTETGLVAATPNGVAWSVDVGAAIIGGVAVDAEGAVYFGAADGVFRAFDASGARLFFVQTGGAIRSSPAIGADGTVYFGGDDGFLYAIGD